MKFIVYERLSDAMPSPAAMGGDRDMLDRCARAEQLGYDAVCLDGELAAERALVCATALAARTSRLPIRVILSGKPREGVEDAVLLDSLPEGRLMLAAPTDVASPRRRVLLGDRVGECELLLEFAFGGLTSEQALTSLERFSREVMPRFSPQPMLPPTLA